MLQKLNHHPDRGGDVEFAQLLNAAASTLCSPEARAHYDQLRAQRLAEDQRLTPKDTSARAEAGGSPNRETSEQPKQRRKPSQKTDTGAPSADKRQQQAYANNESSLLPAKPQCPFCRSSYARGSAEGLVSHGYANANRCQVCNAARTPIAQMSSSSNDELRRIYRHQQDTDARVWPHWPTTSPVDSLVTDFSPAGCALIYPHALKESAVIMLEAELFNAVCLVRHCRASDNGAFAIGLEFITLDMLAKPGTLFVASA